MIMPTEKQWEAPAGFNRGTVKPEPKEEKLPQFGITEAPKDHPDNTSGTMKVIME